ncbi:4Fe-4S binding protein [Thermohalobacter berrensis]|uniref:4Fe-4S ferredoxin n=1 Tax=Thermohalobacter berrensis TaxID=99594 RepID=A0A419T1X9_9FIRM|nr:4Fe-4S ferredoxin [Thermohalobacter berrensis]RKD31570.1 4Fe-4S ferredoxin [Thermohalobacter berrensis]
MAKKSHMSWSWIIMVSFLLLGILDIRFGIFGFVCMGAPIYHAIRGRGKVHCAKYCPRGSLLGKFLARISLQNSLPKWMRTKTFKNILLTLMITVFSISLYHAGWNFKRIAFSVFRFMSMSLAIGIIMGVIYKPRSWCQVCPMGHATGLIKKAQDSKIQNKKLKSA